MKKGITCALLAVMFFAAAAWSAEPENALSSRPDDSVYFVLRLEDTSRFVRWALSNDNLRLIVPLVLGSDSQAEILMFSEIVSSVAAATPLRTAALVVGTTRNDTKRKAPFLQAAFKVSPELSDVVSKIADGTAAASDIARLLFGDKFAAMFAESMIKVESDKSGILRVNNDVFMTAKDDLVVVGASVNDVRLSLRALNEEGSRLFTKIVRKFPEKDFSFAHIDYKTLAELDDDEDMLEVSKFFSKPTNTEIAFERLEDKLFVSVYTNTREAIAKEYAEVMFKQFESLKPVRGGNIDLEGVGGSSSPLLALGTHLDFTSMKSNDVLAPAAKWLVRNMRARFGVTEDETAALITGPLSVAVNDTVTYEGFKLPAVYISKTGQDGAAEKVFSRFTKSQHFSQVQDGVLQLDTSISPVSCLAVNKGETLGINFAELSSLSEKPEPQPALAELLKRESIASMWVDFAGLQAWINNDENGVFTTLAPLAGIMGYGKYVQMFRDIMSAELSVPSMSLWAESLEVARFEFGIREINADNGLFAKLLKVYQDLKAEQKSKDSKTQ